MCVLIMCWRGCVTANSTDDSHTPEQHRWGSEIHLNKKTLLKITIQNGGFTAMPLKNYFWFPKEPFNEQFLKEPFSFLVWRTF